MPLEGLMDSLRLVVDALEHEGIVYAITGSVASGIHGEPLVSLDVDVVARMTSNQAAGLARRLGPRYYADVEMLRRAADDHSLANLYDQSTGLKFDLSVPAATAYHEQVFARRVRVTDPEDRLAFWVVAAEDVVLMKLVWRKDTRSQKQWENALGVVRVQGHRLDWAYLRRWARELDVECDLDSLSREAGV